MRINCWMAVVAGLALVCAAFALTVLEVSEKVPFLLYPTLVFSGCSLAVIGFWARNRRLRAVLGKVSLVVLTTLLTLMVGEAFFRIINFDFSTLDRPRSDLPIYYRKPTVHAGEGVFRRAGPASWQGQVLRSYLRIHGADEKHYKDETSIAVHYDSLGFRNPLDLKDWEAVVTGDSFVELGFLPEHELFTAITAKRLGIRIKNLGLSGTGPISQTFYVNHYGKAPSTKDAILCFFEGNDLLDLGREKNDTESFRTTGKIVARGVTTKQVSLLATLLDRSDRLWNGHKNAGIEPNALLISTNLERPMTIYGPAPDWDGLSDNSKKLLQKALADWARVARTHGMRPWVMYMPDSHRVFHGFIRYHRQGSIASWTPGDFRLQLGIECTNLGIRFIDPYPALRLAAEQGRVPYNLIGDTHLSAEGSQIVASVLTDALTTRETQ